MLLFPGVQDAFGTYLVGGHLGNNQVKEFSGSKIQYFHKPKGKDIIHITGPTNATLRVMVSNTRITENKNLKMQGFATSQTTVKVSSFI